MRTLKEEILHEIEELTTRKLEGYADIRWPDPGRWNFEVNVDGVRTQVRAADFSEMSDAELVEAFVRIVRSAHRQR